MEAQGVEKLMTSIVSGQDANVEDTILANRGFAHPFLRSLRVGLGTKAARIQRHCVYSCIARCMEYFHSTRTLDGCF